MAGLSNALARPSPFQHSLAVGLLLLLAGVALGALRQRGTESCLRQATQTEELLAKCMDTCKEGAGLLTNLHDICASECSEHKEPHTTSAAIWMDHKSCEEKCFPSQQTVWICFHSGGAAVLLTLGILFIASASCGCVNGVCTAYAWVFFLLALVLFIVGVADLAEKVGVQVAFILSATFSILCQALGEFRMRILEQEPQPNAFSRRLGIPVSLIGRAPAAPHEVVDLMKPDLEDG